MSSINTVLKIATRPDIFRRSIIVAAIVGTVLNLINQGDTMMAGGQVSVLKCLLTYMVPFCVATYGAVGALMKTEPAAARQ